MERLPVNITSADRRSFLLEHDPCMFVATLNQDGDESALVLYVSAILEWTDPQFEPILARLNRFCHDLTEKYLVIDEDMVFGQAWSFEFELMSECPGSARSHSCALIDTMTPRAIGDVLVA